jgi:succinate-semialdehyde dehydrogenase/glutarate-semialdehyde dehydrogenase
MASITADRVVVDKTFASDLTKDLSYSGKTTFPVIAPFTGKKLYDLPLSSAQDVTDAAAAGRVAQLAWAAAGHAERRRILLDAHDRFLADRERVLDLLQTETGKNRGSAFEEFFQGASATRYAALTAASVTRSRARRAGIPLVMRTRVSYKPKGLVGVITPWNYPLSLGLMDVIPALATGNAVVQKIDNQTVLTMLAARRSFIDAGVPAALWSIVAGDGGEIGNAVVDAADYVCFTGSTPTGIKVGQRALGRVVGASLELGGKNPMIILDDVKVDKVAASAAYGCFSSMGQLCVSVERLYVQRAIADEFTEAFIKHVGALVQGPALDYSTDVGTLTSAAQLERVSAHVKDAVKKGATVLAGGSARPDLGPYFFEPTVLGNVTADMLCFTNETFGPVVALSVVANEDEAIAAANASEFGLNASIYSGSKARARKLADRITAGSVNINEGYRSSFGSIDAPMGGMAHSGIGRRNGREGLLRFVESRTVAEATGLITLPTTGAAWGKLAGVMEFALRALKALRRR